MKKTIVVILIFTVIITMLFVYQYTRRIISVTNKEMLGNILDIDFNENIVIQNIEYKNNSKENTHIYIRIRVDKNYASQKDYFTYGNSKYEDSYEIFEKRIYDNLLSKYGLELSKIKYDNTVWPSTDNLVRQFVAKRGLEGYHILIFGVNNFKDGVCKEFILYTIIPARIKINTENILNEK